MLRVPSVTAPAAARRTTAVQWLPAPSGRGVGFERAGGGQRAVRIDRDERARPPVVRLDARLDDLDRRHLARADRGRQLGQGQVDHRLTIPGTRA
jgi:hypothetical protein